MSWIDSSISMVMDDERCIELRQKCLSLLPQIALQPSACATVSAMMRHDAVADRPTNVTIHCRPPPPTPRRVVRRPSRCPCRLSGGRRTKSMRFRDDQRGGDRFLRYFEPVIDVEDGSTVCLEGPVLNFSSVAPRICVANGLYLVDRLRDANAALVTGGCFLECTLAASTRMIGRSPPVGPASSWTSDLRSEP